jgi:hypothetical protein
MDVAPSRTALALIESRPDTLGDERPRIHKTPSPAEPSGTAGDESEHRGHSQGEDALTPC